MASKASDKLYQGKQFNGTTYATIVTIKTELSVIVCFYSILGTHDAQNCTANECSRPNTVNVSCAFPENSVALGYLSILCFDNSSREIFVVANRDDMSNSDLNISVSGVPSDNSTVVLFDIRNNGTPPVNNTMLAAGVENVIVTDPDSAGDEEENITVIPESK